MVRVRVSGTVEREVYLKVRAYHALRVKNLLSTGQEGSLGKYNWRLFNSWKEAVAQKKRKSLWMDASSFSATVEELLKFGLAQISNDRARLATQCHSGDSTRALSGGEAARRFLSVSQGQQGCFQRLFSGSCSL